MHAQYSNHRKSPMGPGRIYSLIIFVIVLFTFILGRLFQLQILKHNEYSETAKGQHFGAIDLPARRGEILVKDTHSGEFSKLATNTTLDLLYVDPLVAEDKTTIAKALTPLLFTPEDYQMCLDAPDNCQYKVIQDEPAEAFLTTEPVWDLGLNKTVTIPNSEEEEKFRSYDDLLKEVEENILQKISKLEVDFVILKRDADPDTMANIVNERLPGIFVNTENFLVYGDPTLITDLQLESVASSLAPYLNESPSTIQQMLSRRKVRYVFLKNKLSPEISRKIKDMDFKPFVLVEQVSLNIGGIIPKALFLRV